MARKTAGRHLGEGARTAASRASGSSGDDNAALVTLSAPVKKPGRMMAVY
jgi:hypothetical protein